ncbi:MAG: hypothetical protein M3445_06000 [Actinomycetota bacterium]|nr:hypothetical protein [Actinomycetota bacterium]
MLEQRGRDRLHLAAQALHARVAGEEGQLEPEQQQVEALGSLVVIADRRRQTGEVLDDLLGSLHVGRVGLEPTTEGS